MSLYNINYIIIYISIYKFCCNIFIRKYNYLHQHNYSIFLFDIYMSRNTSFNIPPQSLISLKLKTRNFNNVQNQTIPSTVSHHSNKVLNYSHIPSISFKHHQPSSSFHSYNYSSKNFPHYQLNKPFRETQTINVQNRYTPSYYCSVVNRSHTPTIPNMALRKDNRIHVGTEELYLIKTLKNELQTLNEKNWKLEKELSTIKNIKHIPVHETMSDLFHCRTCEELQKKCNELQSDLDKVQLKQYKEDSQFNKQVVILTQIIAEKKDEVTKLQEELAKVKHMPNNNKKNNFNDLQISNEIKYEIQIEEKVNNKENDSNTKNDFTFPEMLTEDQINKITFLLVKTIKAKEELPQDIFNQIFQSLNNNLSIETLSQTINSRYNLNSIPLINSYIYSFGRTNDQSFSIAKFKEKAQTIFSNPQINQLYSKNNFNINNEITTNCISDIIATCSKFDPQFQGYIHFESFTNVLMNYITKDIITKKGYEYLIYTMKKCPAENYANDLFMVNYRALMPLISQIGVKNDNVPLINKISQQKPEEVKEDSKDSENEEDEEAEDDDEDGWDGGTLIKMIPLEENVEDDFEEQIKHNK